MRAQTHSNCCGVTPIHVGTYTEISESQMQALIGIVQGQSEEPGKHSNRMFEIILNDTQMQSNAKLLKLMASLGFVYVGRMNNGNHDSWINIFQRYQRNGRPTTKPPVEYPGLSVVDTIEAHQLPPITFKRKAVPDPFSQVKGEFDINQIREVIKA